jgi:hypothetical protein
MDINLAMSLEIAWRTLICSIIETLDPHCVVMGRFGKKHVIEFGLLFTVSLNTAGHPAVQLCGAQYTLNQGKHVRVPPGCRGTKFLTKRCF